MEEELKQRKEKKERDLINNEEFTEDVNKSPFFTRTSERREFFDQVTGEFYPVDSPSLRFTSVSKNVNPSSSFLESEVFKRRFHYRTFFLYQVALLLDYIGEAERYYHLLDGDYDFTFNDLDQYRKFFSHSLERAKKASARQQQEKKNDEVEILLAEVFLLSFSFDHLRNEVERCSLKKPTTTRG